MDLPNIDAPADSNINFDDRPISRSQAAKKSVLIKEKTPKFRMDDEIMTMKSNIHNKNRQNTLIDLEEIAIPDDRTLSHRDSSSLRDSFSNHEDKESMDSWYEKEYDFLKEGINQTRKEQRQNLEERTSEIIELLSEKNGEKMSEESSGQESVRENSQQIFSQENQDLFNHNNEMGQEPPVDDIINFFMENSSKKTMLYEHGETDKSLALMNDNTLSNQALAGPKIFKELKGQMKPHKPKQQQISNEKPQKVHKSIFHKTKAPPVLSSLLLLKFGNKGDSRDTNKFQRPSPYISEKRPNEGLNMKKARKLMQRKEENNNKRQKDEDFGETLYQPVQPSRPEKTEKPEKEIKKLKLKKLIEKKKEEREKREKRQVNKPKQETEAGGELSDDSQYFILGENYDIMIECHSTESDFVDIYEVNKRKDDFILETDRSQKAFMSIDKIIHPKKTEIRVGIGYQAFIPRIGEHYYKRTICSIWNPDRIARGKYEEYIEKLSILTKLSPERLDEEKTVETLIDNNYNVELALRFCIQNFDYVKSRIQYK